MRLAGHSRRRSPRAAPRSQEACRLGRRVRLATPGGARTRVCGDAVHRRCRDPKVRGELREPPLHADRYEYRALILVAAVGDSRLGAVDPAPFTKVNSLQETGFDIGAHVVGPTSCRVSTMNKLPRSAEKCALEARLRASFSASQAQHVLKVLLVTVLAFGAAGCGGDPTTVPPGWYCNENSPTPNAASCMCLNEPESMNTNSGSCPYTACCVRYSGSNSQTFCECFDASFLTTFGDTCDDRYNIRVGEGYANVAITAHCPP